MMYVILALFTANVHAGDDWLCKEASSVKRGNSIYACGIAQGHTEQQAKENAFYAARKELRHVTLPSQEITRMEGGRTECEAIPKGEDLFLPGENYYQFKCYRLIIFTLQE